MTGWADVKNFITMWLLAHGGTITAGRNVIAQPNDSVDMVRRHMAIEYQNINHGNRGWPMPAWDSCRAHLVPTILALQPLCKLRESPYRRPRFLFSDSKLVPLL